MLQTLRLLSYKEWVGVSAMDIALTFLQTSLEYSSRLYETMNISQHPFGASWSNSSSSNQQTSVFGALPHPNRSPCVLDFTRFQFSCNPDVFNSAVISQQSRRPIFYFTTDSNAPGYTVMRTADKHALGLVDWRHSRPRVEMHNTMSRRDARDWLRLSNVRKCASSSSSSSSSADLLPSLSTELTFLNFSSRTMEVHGHHYTWRPQGDLICVSRTHTSRMSSRFDLGFRSCGMPAPRARCWLGYRFGRITRSA